jgi:hypothetical protein
MKHGGKADQAILPPVDGSQCPRQKLRRDHGFDFFQVGAWATGLPTDIFNQRFEVTQVLMVLGIIFEQQARKQPLANEKLAFTQHIINGKPDPLGEIQVEVMVLYPDALRLQEGGQRSKLNGGKFGMPERHVDERDRIHAQIALTSTIQVQVRHLGRANFRI